MTVSSISSQTPRLSLLNYMDDANSETDSSQDSFGVSSGSATAARARALAAMAGGTDSSSSTQDAYGMASILGLSDQALAALGLNPSSSTSGSSSGGTTNADDETTIKKSVASTLSKGGKNGEAFAAALDTVFKDVSSDDAKAVRDQVLSLITQLKDPTFEANASSNGSRTTRNGNASVLTLRGSQGAILRLESSNNSDGTTSLRMTYAGSDIGGVELTASRGTGTDGKPTLTADVQQRQILGRGRLSDPVSTDHYSGSL